MKALIQRVSQARVSCGQKELGSIEKGLLILLGVAQGDEKAQADWLVEKISGLRIFEDQNGKMNLSLIEVGGSALVVSQFTLLADCGHGRRPSFVKAAPPNLALELYEYFNDRLSLKVPVAKGLFGANMTVTLTNQGPVTIMVDTTD
jgi:D-tyrosyl-tRNA(Tyr) deacylase